MTKDYYKILGVPRDAEQDEVKKIYRKLAMQYHPDRNPGKEEWANEKFKEINEAFSVLGDPDKRRQYDRFGTVGNMGDIFGSGATKTTFEDMMKDFEGAGLGSGFLDEIFGDIFKNRGSRSSSRNFGGRRCARSNAYASGINLNDLFAQGSRGRQFAVQYEITINKSEAKQGTQRVLTRNKKRLEVKVPAGVKTGNIVRLSNALQSTDGQPGDILIQVKVR